MKIAIYHNLPPGGAKRALYHFTKLLSQEGHTLDLYTLNISEKEFLPLTPYVHQVVSREYKQSPRIEHGHPIIANNRNVYRQLKDLRNINRLSQEMAGLIHTGSYDLAFVTHCRFFQSPNILRYLKIPSVYYCQEPFRALYETKFDYRAIDYSANSFQNFQRRAEEPSAANMRYKPESASYSSSVFSKIAGISYFYTQHILKQNDWMNVQHAYLILANSYYSKEYILRVYGKFALVNYLGVDVEQFRPLPEIKKEHVVLSVGRFYPKKQHHFILHSLAHIADNQRPTLVIIGDTVLDSPYKEYLRQLAQNMHISLQMLDNVSDDELIFWYNRAKVVAYPPILEPFGLVPLEAMACRTPVVGVREGGVRESIIDGVTGFLADRNVQEFGHAIHALLQDETLCQKMGHDGRKHVVKNWTWEKSVEQLIKHFHI